jgi:hypothetical protein
MGETTSRILAGTDQCSWLLMLVDMGSPALLQALAAGLHDLSPSISSYPRSRGASPLCTQTFLTIFATQIKYFRFLWAPSESRNSIPSQTMRREILTLAIGSITLYLGTKAAQMPNSESMSSGYNTSSPTDPTLPSSSSNLGRGGPGSSGAQIARVRGSISDILSGDARRRGGIWWDYGRESTMGSKLGGLWRTTVLVPTDEAVLRLSKKPHLNMDGKADTDSSIRSNSEMFVASHIIPVSRHLAARDLVLIRFWDPQSDIGLPTIIPHQTLGRNIVEIKRGEQGGWVVHPGDIEVVDIADVSRIYMRMRRVYAHLLTCRLQMAG